LYRITEIADLLAIVPLQWGDREASVEQLLIDSRKLTFPSTALFFALSGTRTDGHKFIPQLYEQGVRQFVIDKELNPEDFPQATLFQVPDVLEALQRIATHHRHRFDIPIVGITGSNGKTIVKEWLFQLLHDDFFIARSPKSYNSQIGVPLSVWQLHHRHELGIFEAGISTTNEMDRLAPIIDCTIGILVNVLEAHAEGFRDRHQKIQEKLDLFTHCPTLIYRADDPEVHASVQNRYADRQLVSWGMEAGDWRVENLSSDRQGQQFQLRHQGGPASPLFRLPFFDPGSLENGVHCVLLLLQLGYSPEVIQERLRHLEPVGMRLELKAAIHQCELINDAYNSDISSLGIAIDFMEQQSRHPRRTLILSDILQSGEPPEQLYQKVARLINQSSIDRFIGVGTAIQRIREALSSEIKHHFFSTTEECLTAIPQLNFQRETILIKGARQFAFERLANRLSFRAHKAVLEIDLEAIHHNLNFYHHYLQPQTRMLVMVKASAYGGGSAEIARLLDFQHIDYLGVAYPNEGIELREAGIRAPILVLNADPESFEAMQRYQLEPEIYSLRQLENWLARESRPGDPPIHLKIETGMNRLGLEGDALQQALEMLAQRPDVKVQTIFTHLAAGEDPQEDPFTHQQLQRFQAACRLTERILGYQPWRHVLNSAGIVRFPQYQMEMVRLGIGIYGIDSSHQVQNQLQTVFAMKATISQLKSLKPGETVGYNRQGRILQPTKIATVGIGYADGLLRLAGNGRHQVLVRGQLAPTVGNICMDMCMVDVSKISDVQEGDEVIIFGKQPTVQDLADVYQTIPYEVFTNISSRVKRVYVQT
jgi:alanine racemase